MFWWLNQIGSCFNYIRIRDGTGIYYSKRMFDFVLPAFLAIMTTIVHFYLVDKPVLFGENGILSGFRGLFELLAPFFLAALAAVATFGSNKLDSPLRGRGAILRVQSDVVNEDKYIQLNRRQFICYLFGYLSMMSLVLLIVIVLGDGFSSIKNMMDIPYSARVVGIFLGYGFMWYVLSVTTVGIYFLTDRLHAE